MSSNESNDLDELDAVHGIQAVEELEIVELEERISPFEWACACSTTCKCTTTSCVAWSLEESAAVPDAPSPSAQ